VIHMCSFMCPQVLATPELQYMRKRQLREDIAIKFNELSLNTLQEIFDIISYRKDIAMLLFGVSAECHPMDGLCLSGNVRTQLASYFWPSESSPVRGGCLALLRMARCI
jgi:hypothetical protein